MKVGKDKIRPEQQSWLEAFAKVTKDVYVWRPEDEEEIQEVLFKEANNGYFKGTDSSVN